MGQFHPQQLWRHSCLWARRACIPFLQSPTLPHPTGKAPRTASGLLSPVRLAPLPRPHLLPSVLVLLNRRNSYPELVGWLGAFLSLVFPRTLLSVLLTSLEAWPGAQQALSECTQYYAR